MKKGLKIFIGIIIVFVVIGFFLKGTDEAVHSVANNEMQHVENQVADDAVKQYEIAKRQGDKMQMYTQAQMVCAAYLQAKDEVNYSKWKKIEKEDEKAAMEDYKIK